MLSPRTIVSDPVLTANVYASGLLPSLIQYAILPFWLKLGGTSGGTAWNMWLVRYSRNGEHLKIRLHGGACDREIVKEQLCDCVEAYLDTTRSFPPASPRINRQDAPAIDAEDEFLVPPADRQMLWTTYRRSPISLPGSPWLEDSTFVSLFCKCLSCACDLTLKAAGNGGLGSTSLKQSLLIGGLLEALKALRFCETNKAADYLCYHRNWLLRFFVPSPAARQKVMTHLKNHAERLSHAITHIRQAAECQSVAATTTSEWFYALRELADYMEDYRARPDYRIDFSTSNTVFLPAFKVLHGFANHIGMSGLEEADTYHLVLTAIIGSSVFGPLPVPLMVG